MSRLRVGCLRLEVPWVDFLRGQFLGATDLTIVDENTLALIEGILSAVGILCQLLRERLCALDLDA